MEFSSRCISKNGSDSIFWEHKSVTQEFTDTNLVARKFVNKYGTRGSLSLI